MSSDLLHNGTLVSLVVNMEKKKVLNNDALWMSFVALSLLYDTVEGIKPAFVTLRICL